MRFVFVLFLVVVYVWDVYAVTSSQCSAGYYINDLYECEICPMGYYCNGVDAPFVCPPGPAVPGEWWGASAIGVGTGTVEDCAISYVYGNIPYSVSEVMTLSDDTVLIDYPDVVIAFALVLEAFIEGVPIIENSNYVADTGMNILGGGVLTLQWVSEENKYIFLWSPMTCNRGYWAENGLKDNFFDVFVVESLDGMQPYLCQPVGREYWGTGSFVDIENGEIYGGDIRNACPVGTYTTGFGEGADSEDDCKIWCGDGFEVFGNECKQLCGAGVTKLKISTGVTVPIFADKLTTPALNIKYNNQICYVNLLVGGMQKAVNIKHNNIVYHMVE